MKSHDIINSYERKVSKCDERINTIISLIRKAREEQEDESILDDLREEKANCNRDRQLYIQFIKDLENLEN